MMKPQKHQRTFLFLAASLTALTGCGSSEELRVPVGGTITQGSQPLSTGTVILQPDASKGNASRHEPRGKIDAGGKYQIFTSLVPSALKPGAAPGWYKVSVLATEPMDPKNPYAVAKSLIPAKYNDPEQSGLVVEVVNNQQPVVFDIKLK